MPLADPTLATFADVRTALLVLVQSITDGAFAPDGVGLQVHWEAAKRPVVSPVNGSIVLLSVNGLQGLGIDESRLSFDAGTNLYTETRCGNRLFNFRIKVESYDHTEGKTADYILSRIYSRMQWQSTEDQLNAVNCAYVEDGASVNTTQNRDNRDVMIAFCEFGLSWASNETDTENTFGWIQEAIVDGHFVNNPDGTAHVPQPHLDVVVP